MDEVKHLKVVMVLEKVIVSQLLDVVGEIQCTSARIMRVIVVLLSAQKEL